MIIILIITVVQDVTRFVMTTLFHSELKEKKQIFLKVLHTDVK